MPSEEAEARDYVDNAELPGADLARRYLVVATLWATGLLVLWLAVSVLDRHGLGGIDLGLMQALHDTFDTSDPVGPAWLESAMRDVTALGSNIVITFVVIATATFLAMTHRLGPAILLVSTTVATFLLNAMLKAAFERARPDFLATSVTVGTSSFPSSHAMLSCVLYLLLAAIAAREVEDRRTAIALFSIAAVLTAAVGFSRIYLGAHWPSDVLAGWALGAACALAGWQLARSPRPPGPAK